MKFKRTLMSLLAAMTVWGAYPYSEAGAATVTTGTIQYGVNFRPTPSTSSSVIRMIGKGEEVVVLNRHNSAWYRVQDVFGTIGYISTDSKYLKMNAPVQAPSAANASIVSSVSLRTGPSTGASRIRYLSKGEQVTVKGQHNAYWYEVTDSRGQTGYVSTNAKYIQVTGPVGGPSQPVPPSNGAGQQIESVIAAGMKYLGTPYEFGSSRSNTSTFDCSDLVRQMFKDALGIVLPADSRGQGDYVRDKSSVTTNWRHLKRGDLMFFMDYKGTSSSRYSGKSPFSTRISHVAIYLGDGKVLHTYSKESGGVRTDSIAGKHWEHRFLFGGSAL
ncbi:SH3 domain-containing protein [Cohnella hongkongensis]|uniref:SH3 domain-containing protein n=1 Tax=Cohnella hongkongensis TaxID=178337 RepID=A0ABV9F8D5_9BACL